MAFTPGQLRPFTEKIETSHRSLLSASGYKIIIDYLTTGQANGLAGISFTYEGSGLYELYVLLKPPHHWDEDDQLVLDVVTTPGVWKHVKIGFTTLVTRHVSETGTEQDWNILIGFLQKHFPLIELFQKILYQNRFLYNLATWTTENSLQANWLKAYMRSVDKNALAIQIKHHSQGHFIPNFLGLLIECVPDAVDGYLQPILENGQLFNIEAIYPALSYNAEKYLAYIIEKIKTHHSFIKTRESVENRSTVLMMLQKKHPGSVNELLIEVAKDYLAIYPSIEHKGHEHTINIGRDRYVFSGLSATILLEADPPGTKEKLWEIIQQAKFLHYTVLKLLVERFNEAAIPFVVKALQADVSISGVYYHKYVLDLLKNFGKDKYIDALWELVQHKSKQVRQLVIGVLSEDDKAIEKGAALLDHKSADTRQAVAQILGRMPSPAAKEVLRNAIANEKNDDARDIMLQSVGEELYDKVTDDMLAQLVEEARNRGKLTKPLEEWLDEDALPALYYNNGKQLSNEEVRFLLYRMERVKVMRSDLEARLVINRLDKEKSAGFALHLIKLFIDKETKPEHKYLLALSALLGNDAVADKIRIAIDKWIDNSRFKMAEYGVGALALQGSNKALRWVELYSRKYKTKKANVGAAALLALEAAAEELNITVYELGDRIVPDFGFEGLFKEFTIDGDNYRAFIDSNFKIAFFNDDNKKLKAIPASAANELKDEFKSIAKDVKDIVKSQSSRLEHYLVVQRRWNKEQWEQFFLTNPVMFIYATKLLWGVYENNELKQCFYCQEDTTLMDADDNEISLEEDVQIGIVHPLQLLTEELKKWQRKFFDLSIEPVFPQLERNLHALAPEDKEVTLLRTFDGTKTDSGSVRSTLERSGWRKGPTEGGSIDTFFKDEDTTDIMAVLEVEGVWVAGFDSGLEARLGRLYFRKRDGKNIWITQPIDDKDPVLIPLGNLPEVFYSEVISAIKTIKVRTASDAG